MASEEIKALLPYAVNFSVLAVVVAVVGKKQITKAIYQRHERIKDFVNEAKTVHDAAQKRINAIESKLNAFENEKKNILSSAALEGNKDGALLLDRAKHESVRIASEAQRIVENENSDRQAGIRGEFLNKVLDQTAETLKKNLKNEDHTSIINEARNRLEVNA